MDNDGDHTHAAALRAMCLQLLRQAFSYEGDEFRVSEQPGHGFRSDDRLSLTQQSVRMGAVLAVQLDLSRRLRNEVLVLLRWSVTRGGVAVSDCSPGPGIFSCFRSTVGCVFLWFPGVSCILRGTMPCLRACAI